ncbi:MAG: hypothetical protein II826_01585 [Prevotella sp.]|nr:hypothetical protein [Prevotella sp.]
MKRILTTLVVLLALGLTTSAQNILMKVVINGEQTVKDKNGNEVVLGGVLELPYDAFTSIEYIVQEPKADERAVNLGLQSGTLWASMNYGATSEKELGTTLPWAELNQIANDSKWGGYWKVPNKAQAQELIDECDWEPVKENDDVVGYNVYSRENENSIFIPVTKGYYRGYDGRSIRSNTSFYWTSTADSDKGYALTIADGSNSPAINSYATSGENSDVNNFNYLMAVRPVWVKTAPILIPSVAFTEPIVSNETDNSAICTFTISGDYDKVTVCGICYAADSKNALETNPKFKNGNHTNGKVTVTLSGLNASTTYYIRAYAIVEGLSETQFGNQTPSFVTSQIVIEDYKKPSTSQIVDLGLSVYWAPWNMGGNTAGDKGKYIGWGVLDDETKDMNNSKYAPTINNGTSIAGNPEYDIATEKWGEKWSIPTVEEFEELLTKCTFKEDTETDLEGNTINGYRITGPSGKSIFMPWAGRRLGENTSDVNTYGNYWTAKAGDTGRNFAYGVTLNTKNINQRERYQGYSIRPVYKGDLEQVTENDETLELDESGTGAPKAGVDFGGAVKWAQWNIGATGDGQTGDFFSWGDTETKTTYAPENTPLYGQKVSALTAEQDVVRQKWGGKWRMPKSGEFRQLMSGATLLWTGNGLKVTKNGKSIFFPAAGYKYKSGTGDVGVKGYYWSSTPYSSSESEKADIFELNSNTTTSSQYIGNQYRYYGLQIRPVWDPNL